MKNGNRTSNPRTMLIGLGLASLGAFAIACGDADSDTSSYDDTISMMTPVDIDDPDEAEALEVEDTEQAYFNNRNDLSRLQEQTRSKYPVVQYQDRMGMDYLECRTGAQVGPLQLHPESGLREWLADCAAGITNFSVYEAQISECHAQITQTIIVGGDDDDADTGTTGLTGREIGPPPTAEVRIDGKWYWACTGGHVDMIESQSPGTPGSSPRRFIFR